MTPGMPPVGMTPLGVNGTPIEILHVRIVTGSGGDPALAAHVSRHALPRDGMLAPRSR